jgi:hypothetical protein
MPYKLDWKFLSNKIKRGKFLPIDAAKILCDRCTIIIMDRIKFAMVIKLEAMTWQSHRAYG